MLAGERVLKYREEGVEGIINIFGKRRNVAPLFLKPLANYLIDSLFTILKCTADPLFHDVAQYFVAYLVKEIISVAFVIKT